MSLQSVMAAIKSVEEAIELPDSVVRAMNAARFQRPAQIYELPPRAKNLVAPCFMNWPDAAAELRMGDMREDNISVQVDFFGPASHDGTAIALAYFDATWAAFDAERVVGRRLRETVDYFDMRAERPMISTMEWNGLGYPGFRIYLDLVLFTEVATL